MLKIVTVALVIVEVVLITTLALAPAEATISDAKVYTWSFAYPGNHQLVCQQLVIHPEKQVESRLSHTKSVKISSLSTIVNDKFCANLTKPVH